MTKMLFRSGRFLAVAAICLLTHNAVMVLGDYSGLSLIASVGLSFIIVVIIGYLGHSRFTYHEPVTLTQFSRYTVAMAANLPTALLTVWLARDLFGLPMPIAAPLSTLVSLGINYVLSRWAISPHRPAQD